MERVGRWRKALTEAANLSGWHLRNDVDGDEAILIRLVVREVTNRLDQLYCDVADFPVGIDSRVQELKRILKLEIDDVFVVAIWGVGGIGKTTIAKAVFNSIRNQFEGSSFLADVRETTKTSSGVVSLQKQLLSNILRNNTLILENYHHGINLIKRKIGHCRVLLVLDDVDHVQQLKMLAISRDLFCAGSRIIITTRNKSSLTSIQVDSLYSPLELNGIESVKLFSWNAFKTDYPEEDYLKLSQEVVTYAEGLPLALEVLGSYFSDRTKAEWESGLRKLRKHPLKDIQGKLKISFESLDKNDQDLFLDIAFFFIGMDKDFAVKVLEDLECFPEIGIGELARRCLIRVDEYNKLSMHNLLRDMAREIIYLESMKEPSKRSRLRGNEEVLQVLRDTIGRETIEGLYLELPELNNEVIDVVVFTDMRNLRLLHLNNLCRLRGTNITISRKLKLLCWHRFPLAHIPDDLYMENLVAIDMQYSRLKQIWKGPKRLDKLRFLNLSYSRFLIKTPDFSGLKNLEELLLHDCANLVEVHYSIGCLEKLIILDMGKCTNLRNIPSSILMLKSLQHLDLSGCSIPELEKSRGPLSMFRSLRPRPQELLLISEALLQGVGTLRHLTHLNLSWCNLSSAPSEIGNLTSLQSLDLSGNIFSSIPSTVSDLCHLSRLVLHDCHKLKHLPALPSNLEFLDARGCLSLESESVGTLSGGAKEMMLAGCPKLDGGKIARDIIQSFRDDTETNIFLPSSEICLDLDFHAAGSSLSFVVPNMGEKVRGWIVRAVVYKPNNNLIRYEVVNKTKGTKTHYPPTVDGIPSWYDIEITQEVMWLSSLGLYENGFDLEGGDEMEFLFFCTQEDIKKCGMKLIYEGDENAL